MKFKSLLLTAAITAASFSGVANASIDGVTSGNSVNSDLVLVIYDTVKDLSFVQNLDGHNFDTILASGNYTGSFSLNASALNIFSASNKADLTWSLAATNFNPDDIGASGLVVSSNSAVVSVQDEAALSNVNVKFKQLSEVVNQSTAIGAPTNALAASGAAGTQLSGAAKIWNDHISTQVDFANSAAASVKQSFWLISENPETGDILSSKASQSLWTLDLTSLSAATLSNATPVANTPLPAAAWLMVSALMGLGGIARRRNAKV